MFVARAMNIASEPTIADNGFARITFKLKTCTYPYKIVNTNRRFRYDAIDETLYLFSDVSRRGAHVRRFDQTSVARHGAFLGRVFRSVGFRRLGREPKLFCFHTVIQIYQIYIILYYIEQNVSVSTVSAVISDDISQGEPFRKKNQLNAHPRPQSDRGPADHHHRRQRHTACKHRLSSPPTSDVFCDRHANATIGVCCSARPRKGRDGESFGSPGERERFLFCVFFFPTNRCLIFLR